MTTTGTLCISSVCLERNRWSSRNPSFAVSDWLPRFVADDFDGVELWENHYLAADASEQERLADSAQLLPLYNSYVGFGDDASAAREQTAAAITRLGPAAVKYNLGSDPAECERYGRNLLDWAEQLPRACRLLCECHEGTVLARIEDAVAFLEPLDPARFGVIVHPLGDPEGVAAWFDALGPRIQHLHLQMRSPAMDPTVAANRERMDACFEVVKAHGFSGGASIEFTRGIGRDEDIETVYANACIDRDYCRTRLS